MKNIDFSLLDKLGARLDKGGEPPDDGRMEARLTALETRLDTVLPTLATKADLGEVRSDIHKVDSSIKTWMLATMLTIIGTMLAAIFGINQIYKTAPSGSPQTAPIIIQLPAQQSAPPPTPGK
jgi:hypothetical protein